MVIFATADSGNFRLSRGNSEDYHLQFLKIWWVLDIMISSIFDKFSSEIVDWKAHSYTNNWKFAWGGYRPLQQQLHWNAEKSDKTAKQNCALWFWSNAKHCQTKLCFVILVKRKAHTYHRFRMTEATQVAGMKGTKIANGNDFKFVNRQICILGGSSFEQFSAEYNYRSGAQQYRQFVGMHMRDSWYRYPRDRG